jgi:hypothetical protein
MGETRGLTLLINVDISSKTNICKLRPTEYSWIDQAVKQTMQQPSGESGTQMKPSYMDRRQ